MILFLCKKHRKTNSAGRLGFSMVEMAIVLGVFGIILSGIWALAGQARQKSHLNDAIQDSILIADGMRSMYMGQASVKENYPDLTPELIKDEVFPSNLVHSALTLCPGNSLGVAASYADTPWQPVANVCGNLNVCRWDYPNMKACDAFGVPAPGTPEQYFGISFDGLDYASCVALTSGLTPSQIPGLVDVSVGLFGLPGVYAVSGIPGNTMPASVAWAQAQCAKASNANRVVFVVTLRAPST